MHNVHTAIDVHRVTQGEVEMTIIVVKEHDKNYVRRVEVIRCNSEKLLNGIVASMQICEELSDKISRVGDKEIGGMMIIYVEEYKVAITVGENLYTYSVSDLELQCITNSVYFNNEATKKITNSKMAIEANKKVNIDREYKRMHKVKESEIKLAIINACGNVDAAFVDNLNWIGGVTGAIAQGLHKVTSLIVDTKNKQLVVCSDNVMTGIELSDCHMTKLLAQLCK